MISRAWFNIALPTARNGRRENTKVAYFKMLISESLSYLVDAALPCAAFFFCPSDSSLALFVARLATQRRRGKGKGRQAERSIRPKYTTNKQ